MSVNDPIITFFRYNKLNHKGIFVKHFKATSEERAMTLCPLSSLCTSVASDHFSTTTSPGTHMSKYRHKGGVAGHCLIWSFHLSGHLGSKSKQACGFTKSMQYLQAINSVNDCLCKCCCTKTGFRTSALQYRTAQSVCMFTKKTVQSHFSI